MPFEVREDSPADGLEKECESMKGVKKSARFLAAATAEWCCHFLRRIMMGEEQVHLEHCKSEVSVRQL